VQRKALIAKEKNGSSLDSKIDVE